MYIIFVRRALVFSACLLASFLSIQAQDNVKLKFNNSVVYTGIEVGAKGVKMSMVELGKNAQSKGAFNILKDTSVNTDFITFNDATFQATLNALTGLYTNASRENKIPSKRIFTVVSSGVKVQAEKDDKSVWINNLIDSFKLRIKEPTRNVEVVDVLQEARLSHLGIIPDARRYNTFLIDIGSGNTKGGYFPYGNLKDFYLFQVPWGTKSTTNAVDKRTDDDKTLPNFNKQMARVLSGIENNEVALAVNASGGYPLSDNIAFSGGIVWSVATLLYPDQIANTIVQVTYDDVAKFSERIYKDYASLSAEALTKDITIAEDKAAAAKEIKRVHGVFDQKSLMAGAGLLLKIMRQFSSALESKQFYFVKNGQVGWISAYVDQSIGN